MARSSTHFPEAPSILPGARLRFEQSILATAVVGGSTDIHASSAVAEPSPTTPPITPAEAKIWLSNAAEMPKHFRVTTNARLAVPSNHLSISLDGALGWDQVFVKTSGYRSVRDFLNDLYNYYLCDRYNPFTYGEVWLLVQEETNRLMIDWPWLSCSDRRRYSFDREWASAMSLESCGLDPMTKWRIMPVYNIAFGVAVNNENLFTIALHYKKKLRHLIESDILVSMHAKDVDLTKYKHLGIFLMAAYDTGSAQDEVFVQREGPIPPAYLQEIAK